MSAAQPGPAAPTAVSVPRFPITLWGYERRHVDRFVTGLVKALEGERQRGDQAQRALRQLQQDVEHGRAQVPAWFSSVGAEVDQVLDNAGRAAAKLLAEAGRRIQAATDAAEMQAAERIKEAEEQVRKLEEVARGALADAQAEGARIEAAAGRAAEEQLNHADHDARELLARAHDEARRLQDLATDERQQIEAERQRLATLRQSMVEQLVQVYAPLGLKLVDARGELKTVGDDRQLEPKEPSPVAAMGPGAETDAGATPVPGAAVEPDDAAERGAATEPGVVDGHAVQRLDAWAKQEDGAP